MAVAITVRAAITVAVIITMTAAITVTVATAATVMITMTLSIIVTVATAVTVTITVKGNHYCDSNIMFINCLSIQLQ